MIFDSIVDFYSTSSGNGFFTSNDIFIYLLSEITNLIFCCLVISLFFFANKLSFNELLFWIFLFLLAFFINIFINSTQFFPDIGGYLRCVRDLRDNFSFDELGCQVITNSSSDGSFNTFSIKRGLPALMFFLVPMPSIATYSAIGMITKLFTFLLYLYLKKILIQKDNLIILCLAFLLPTFLLYSSVGLRDGLIFIVMAALMFSIIRNKFLLSTFVLLILLLIKPQNGAVFIVPYIGVFLFGANKSMKGFIMLLLFSLTGLILIQDLVLSTINFFILSFIYENQGSEILKYVEPYTSLFTIIAYSPIEFFNGLLRPYPTGLVSSLFFFDSLIQLLMIATLIILNRGILFKSPEFLLVFLTFFMGMVLNSMVVDNDNTFIRYKYTFVYCLLIYLITINKYPIKFFKKSTTNHEK